MADDVKDIAIYTGSEWTSLSELTGGVVDAKLPIESVDGTVVLSDSSGSFVVSTGGTESVRVRSKGNVGVGYVGYDWARLTSGGTNIQSGGTPAVAVAAAYTATTDGTGATPQVFSFYSFPTIVNDAEKPIKNFAHFYATNIAPDIVENHYGLYVSVAGGQNAFNVYAGSRSPNFFGGDIQVEAQQKIECRTYKGPVDSDASVSLGASFVVSTGGEETMRSGSTYFRCSSAAGNYFYAEQVGSYQAIWIGGKGGSGGTGGVGIQTAKVTGEDKDGRNLTIASGASTGAGLTGELVFATSNVGSSGSTENSVSTRLKIDNQNRVLVNTPQPPDGTPANVLYVNGSAIVSTSVKTPSVSGRAATDASVTLAASAIVSSGENGVVALQVNGAGKLTISETDFTVFAAYEAKNPTSLATKKTVDDKIWVGTTAQYLAIPPRDILPTTLYCLTD